MAQGKCPNLPAKKQEIANQRKHLAFLPNRDDKPQIYYSQTLSFRFHCKWANDRVDFPLFAPSVGSPYKCNGCSNYLVHQYGRQWFVYGRDRLVHFDTLNKCTLTLWYSTNCLHGDDIRILTTSLSFRM